ncbi:hypothetical protein WDW86_03410 [Bdellovibrionota bacterium FG-2]
MSQKLLNADHYAAEFGDTLINYCLVVRKELLEPSEYAKIEESPRKNTEKSPAAYVLMDYLKTFQGSRLSRELCTKTADVTSVDDPRLEQIPQELLENGWNKNVSPNLKIKAPVTLNQAVAYNVLWAALSDPAYKLPRLGERYQKARDNGSTWNTFQTFQSTAKTLWPAICGDAPQEDCLCLGETYGKMVIAAKTKEMIPVRQKIVTQTGDLLNSMFQDSIFSKQAKDSFAQASDQVVKSTNMAQEFMDPDAARSNKFNAAWSPVFKEFSINLAPPLSPLIQSILTSYRLFSCTNGDILFKRLPQKITNPPRCSNGHLKIKLR